MRVASPFKTVVFFLLTMLTFGSTAQAQTLVGTIREASTSQPVPYANIGIPGKDVGTVADAQGHYQLSYTAANLADTVRLSSIGYEPRRVLLRELLAKPDVVLASVAVALADVRVQAPGLFKRRLTLGNTSHSEVIIAGMAAEGHGAEVGVIISLRHQPTKVQQARFNLLYTDSTDLTFRVNLYRLLPDGQPSNEKLNRRDIIVHSNSRPNHAGPLVVDLTPDNLVLDEDFLLTLEWVAGGTAHKFQEVHELRKNVYFSAALGYFGQPPYIRKTSQGKWEKMSLGARLAGMQFKVGFNVTALD
ncbi:carboxypeptidase-like regulatory domain-containing protein [Hymenobacter lapidiphilus]|uniref:carboxypeptidase-like regulatory domain-containing protein n=1 Tax=Hymenobacter sp. CCM 8763 TaxID=2303334 RepID=UPI000E349E1C|nr:carboxypeptidase-like regulatory domain-containing protein [Hymenobacter sp. CCM 8763]RFP66843.1 carboxypeptidase-like regulatory domain-containing protein [Hymenobacter sp. CCM 8763]